MNWHSIHRAKLKQKTKFLLYSAEIIIMGFFVNLFLFISVCFASTLSPVEEDIEMQRFSASQKSSEWLDSEKKIYHALLMKNQYDVLIVPFQVQGYAIDRPGRSLMTRYLAHRIETTTDSKLPSLTLVARALGETERTYRDADIYQLANDLKVKIIIRGYVGHHRDKEMKLTLLVQVRDENGMIGPSTTISKIEKNDVPFSDELLPSEVFLALLDDIMTELPFKQTEQPRIITAKEEKKLALPDNPRQLFNNERLTVVQKTYYLELLGALYPEESVARDSLFERALVSLMDISPKSPDYALLKARAYYYLNRRPAAMTALASPVRSEEKAFVAFLNGNMLALEKFIDDIKKPIPRLLAQIELNDLRWRYGDQRKAKRSYKKITKDMPAWEMVVTRRLQSNDNWEVQSNLLVKQALDEYFPVPDYTAKSLSRSSIALGEMPSENEDIELSVYNHQRKFITIRGSSIMENESSSLVERDLMDLLAAIGEANLLNKARVPIHVQALPERGLEILRRYESIYQDHPQLTYLKSFALWMIAESKQGQVKENIKNQAKSTARNACYWFQGQTFAGRRCSDYDYYDGDFPRRSYWTYRSSLTRQGDRKTVDFVYLPKSVATQQHTFDNLNEPKNYELAILYTVSDFEIFEAYYNRLMSLGLTKEADNLLVKNQHRFIGHPSRTILYARLQEGKGNKEAAIKIYEEAINATPEIWGSYWRLGDLYIRQGEFVKAADIYRQYPLFDASDDPDIDTVALSNQAAGAGDNLWWHGAIQEALPFYRLSAGYETGSGAGMNSSVALFIFDGKYQEAARELRELAKRYDQIRHYSDYITLLHIMGYGDEAWSIFKSRDFMSSLDKVKRSIIVAHRIEGKTEEQQRKWLFQQDLKKIPVADVQTYIAWSHLYDRPVDESLPSIIDGVAQKIGFPTDSKQRSWWAWFVDGYNNTRLQRYSKAYDIFCGRRDSQYSYYLSDYSLPYGVWSGVKSGKLAEVETNLKTYRERYGETFYYHLAQAFIISNRKNHEDAIKHLEAARATMWAKEWQLFPWHQLVETCEWLYEDSAYTGYRDLALKLAKVCQKIRYESAWTYAVEAKYTDSESDRIRALGITLYLDKRSERISGISDKEKHKALAWLKRNNPFIRTSTKGSTSEI